MNKEELIKKLEDIEWEDFEMITGWDSQYHLKPLIDGDFDFYKITFPTITTTQKTTQKIQNLSRKELLALLENNVGSKLVETVGSKLVENQLKIVLLILEDEKITKTECLKY